MQRVLLVLDSEDLAAILCKELSSYYKVEICDAAAAVDIIDHYRPEALIMDLFLSGTDGFHILQNSTYRIPSIILLTVLHSTDIINHAAELKVNYIFLKPFKLSVLTKRLYELLPVEIK